MLLEQTQNSFKSRSAIPFMRDKISKICRDLEQRDSIKILFAVENGSRAWRMASEDSDYDVRFVYARPLKEYLQIKRPEQVINASFDENGNPCTENAFIDLSGFDIFKYAELLSKSNPTTIEWLITDIVYYGKQNEVFQNFALNYFSKTSLYHHYRSLCRDNYTRLIQSKKKVTHKVYLYAFRGLINALWVVHKESVPPIVFQDALQEMEGILPTYISEKLYRIIEMKARGKERRIVDNIEEMDTYIEQFINDSSEIPWEKSHPPVDMLNKELQRILLEHV